MKDFKRWLLPVAIVSLLLVVLVGGSCAPQSLGEALDPSGNPFAHRFSDVTDIRTATFVVAASDSVHKYEADYFCDGTDDHIQIQQAIDALPATGGEVLFLDGTYNIEVSLVLDSYQTLRGCGRNTILTTTTADTDIITATGSSGSEKVGITIADLCIDGNAGGAVNDVGIIWTYVNYSKIWNIWCQNIGEDGIDLAYCEFNEITGTTIDNLHWDCIYLSPSSNYNTISGNIFSRSCIGVDLNESNCNTISGNTFSDNDNAIYMSGSHGNTISGNTLLGESFVGIYLSDCHGNTISGNTVMENGQEGIALWLSSNNTISGNTVGKNLRHGILIANSLNNTISGNSCQGNGQLLDNSYDNIHLLGSSDYNLIANNLCRAPTIGTTLTDGEPIGETEIAVTDIAGFEAGMGVVIDLGGANEEYHLIIAISGGAPGVITIDAGLTNAQGAGETIDVPEARYGINISNATGDGNLVIGNDLYDSGKTANFNDAGTGTIVWEDNRGITPVQVKHLIYVQNTSGGNLLTGNVVKYNAAAGSVGFTTPTAVGDDGVWGMLVEDIDNNAWGYIQILGGTTLLDTTNAGGAIVIGDFLCAEIGVRARLAAAGNMVFAIALEDCDAADCVIDALIIVPRKI